MGFDFGRSKGGSDVGAVDWLGVQVMVYEILSTMLYLPKSLFASGIPGFYLVCLRLCWFLGIQLEISKGIPSDFPLAFVLQNGLLCFGWHLSQFHRKMKLLINSQSKSLKLMSLRIKGEARLSLLERYEENLQLPYHCT